MAGFNDEELEQLQTFFEGSERRMEVRLTTVIKQEVSRVVKEEVSRAVKEEVAKEVTRAIAPLREDVRQIRSDIRQMRTDIVGIRREAKEDRRDAREDVDAVVSDQIKLERRVTRLEKAHALEPVA